MLIKFGIWEVDEDFGITGKVHVGYDYHINKERLWETQDYNGRILWDWLIHLTEKTWINLENVNNLNTAFYFCQDYFKQYKPADTPEVSTAQTLYIQKQLIEIGKNFSEQESELGISFTSKEGQDSFFDYLEALRKVKFLKEQNSKNTIRMKDFY